MRNKKRTKRLTVDFALIDGEDVFASFQDTFTDLNRLQEDCFKAPEGVRKPRCFGGMMLSMMSDPSSRIRYQQV